eukprot:COSAG03_NODE_4379_length_1570_cov_8.227056_2_plen_90_part_00
MLQAIAAEHDELITKFHENQNKLRVAESEPPHCSSPWRPLPSAALLLTVWAWLHSAGELKANLAREQTLVAHVEAATQERKKHLSTSAL